MSATIDESKASLRLLVCMAKADGVLHDKEREALQASLSEIELPEGTDLESLLAEDHDIDAVFGLITSPEARDQAYSSAFAMACADGECSAEENELLERARKSFQIDEAQHRFLERVFKPHTKEVVTGKPGAGIAFEGIERDAKIKSTIRKTAIVCGLLGAFPVPGLAIATDLTVAYLQVELAKDIAKFWGREMDTENAKGLLAGFGVGTGARIAVTNLLKVFPGWGAAVGAATAYASTYGVGSVVSSYFENGEGLDPVELKKQYEQAKAEAKEVYKQDKDHIAEKEKTHREELKDLNAKLKDGAITQAEFEDAASHIAD